MNWTGSDGRSGGRAPLPQDAQERAHLAVVAAAEACDRSGETPPPVRGIMSRLMPYLLFSLHFGAAGHLPRREHPGTRGRNNQVSPARMRIGRFCEPKCRNRPAASDERGRKRPMRIDGTGLIPRAWRAYDSI